MLTRDASSPFPVTTAGEARIDRRRFLGTCGAAAAVALLGDRLGRRAEHAFTVPTEIPAATTEQLAVGEARAIVGADGRETLAVRLDADTVVAFDRRCPHLGCPVLWAAERGRFECPCHHAAFDARTGAVLFGPPRRGLTQARTRA
jgi:Rieske Fe-S protein